MSVLSLSNEKKELSAHQKTGRSALLMSAGTMVSRVLGLVRDMVIGSFFSRTETDAFFAAFRIPNFFRRFLGEGALSISFIPIFIHYLSASSEKQSLQKAKNFMNSIYTIVLLVVSLLTALGVIFMEPLLSSLFEGTPFAEVEGKLSMAITMARLLFLYLFLVVLYAYFMGIAHALGKFFIPALAPAFLNIFMILFAFLPKDITPFPALLLCYGTLTGGAVQLILTAGLLFRLGFLPRPVLSFRKEDMNLFVSRFLPGAIGVGGFALIGLLNLYFSGWLEEGTHTYIYYGDRLLELPRSLIAISLGTALLPSLSYLSAQGEKMRLWKTAADQRDLLLFLILPCALAFYYLGLPIVEVLFQRGRFDAFTAEKTALVLKIYSLLLISSSLCRVLAVCFYAVKNTWYPCVCSGLYVLFHWLFTPYMIRIFGLEGLVGASVASNVFFMLLLAGAYPFFVGRFYLGRTLKRGLYLLPVLFLLALHLKFSLRFLKEMFPNVPQVFFVFCVIVSSIVLYLGVAWLLHLPSAKEFLEMVRKKRHKK